jgi:hypothetical protein
MASVFKALHDVSSWYTASFAVVYQFGRIEGEADLSAKSADLGPHDLRPHDLRTMTTTTAVSLGRSRFNAGSYRTIAK